MSGADAIRDRQRCGSDPDRSVWVRANAGSGKTRVLVERVLRILLAGTPPDRILALTFTKAAAAEMKERLFKTLGEWTALDSAALEDALTDLEGSPPDDDKKARARRLFARALETPGGLKIQTIHGFCQGVLERFPIEAGVPPHFQVLDDVLGAELRTEAKAIVLSTIGTDDTALQQALARIIDEVGELQFDEVIDALIQKPAMLRRARREDPDHAGLRSTLGLPEGANRDALVHAFIADCPIDRLRDAARALIEAGTRNPVTAGEKIAAFCAAPGADTLPLYLEALLKQDGAARKLDGVVTKKIPDRDRWIALLEDEQARAETYLGQIKALATFDRTTAISLLGDAIIALYDRMKAVRGVLDYEDLILKTADLLERENGAAAWVLYKLDAGIDHILVDEAQDTSPDQWRVVSALAAEFFAGMGARDDVTRTVFAVGDEKQSIYSFQGADPRGFALTEEAMAHAAHDAGLAFEAVSLPVSFRSAPPVLALVDEVSATPAIRQSLTFDDLPVGHEAYRAGHAGSVELWPLIAPLDEPDTDPWDVPLDTIGSNDPKAVLAGRIARTIRDWLDSGERLEARNRPIEPGDIMILVRRRDSFVDALVRALKAERVPVAGTDRIKVTDQIAVMDLMAAAQFALLPDDDLTLATLLKSPLIGFGEEQLFALAHGRPASLWQALGESAVAEARAAREWLEKLIEAAQTLRPADFFQHILSVMDGRKRLTARLGEQVHDPVDEFLALALGHEESETPSLQGFLDWVGRAGAEIKRDMERGTGQVRIMTVHGAKGLEANLVILPDTMSPPTGRTLPPIVPARPERRGDAQFLWLRAQAEDDPVSKASREAVRDADRREYCRLLYVALTRARDRLIVCGFAGKKASSEAGWHTMVEPAMEALGERTLHRFADGEETEILRFASTQTAKPIEEDAAMAIPAAPPSPDWIARPAPPEPSPSRPLTPSRALADDPPVQSPLFGLPNRTARQRGTIIHRLLELLADCSPAARPTIGRQFLAQTCSDIHADERQAWLDEVLAILTDPTFASIFAPGSLAEVPVSGLVARLGSGLVLSGQIDRLSVTPDEILLVDFKTNRPPPARVEEVAEAYLLQMASYRAALAEIYPDRPIRAGLLWTDAPRLMELPQELLDAAEIRARTTIEARSP